MSFLVHVSSSESRQIHAFVLDAETGALRSLEVIDVPGSGAPTRGNIPLTWSRDGKVLYAQIRIAPYPLSAFVIDPTSGKLRLLQTVALPAPMAYLSVTRNGRFLLAASYDDALLTVNRLEASGRVSVPGLQTLTTPPKAHCIVEAPFGPFVYATSVDGEAILVYRLNEASGHLEDLAPSTTVTRPHSGPRHLVFHPTLDRLYCVNEHAGSVAAYSVERESGMLKELQYESIVPADFSGRALGADIHLTRDGALLYASVRKTNSISAFHIDPATGALLRAGEFDVEAYPRGFAIEPNGRFLLCAGQQSNHLAVYAIKLATGALSQVGRYPVGMRPSWIEIVPAPAG
ncbi:3-carboxymuconate cyclase-like protein [Caballeronia sordidicola]|uniref:3-carboxymuconate cyclase-like protein n=1 Tax=Caballeronia sordidicola TaxID=196367 RepID=A0A158I0C9_CABSO|nr:lactonase family protein [Caballeronia sordidicola]SAL49907.1 3-carboxymuconate cyclase-like protein [Caballeronia sordidicola]